MDSITEALYEQTMDAQEGVVLFLLDQMAEDHVKEAAIAYFVLLSTGGEAEGCSRRHCCLADKALDLISCRVAMASHARQPLRKLYSPRGSQYQGQSVSQQTQIAADPGSQHPRPYTQMSVGCIKLAIWLRRQAHVAPGAGQDV